MRYVAIGDSFTEGLGDSWPDGSPRGWADRVAMGLASALGEPVHYANLAIRGRLYEPIATEQLDAALSLSPAPTLISLNGGGNDMMRPGADMGRLIRLTERAVGLCSAAGVPLLLLSGPDPSRRLPLGGLMRRRGAMLTSAVADLAGERGLTFVDMFNDTEVRRPVYWSPDRLHLNASGHRRVAGFVLAALGHGSPDHRAEATALERRRALNEIRYYREHVLPWVQRRVRGRSSGDGRTAKHPSWSVMSSDGPGRAGESVA